MKARHKEVGVVNIVNRGVFSTLPRIYGEAF